IELSGSYPARPAQLGDAMQTVIMNSPHDSNYQLQASTLSPTWCTWFMPIRTNQTYELQPVSTQVNNQATNIKIPPWQMTRICQDQQGHFWASPPLLAGAGINIAPGPKGLTISSGAGGMDYITGGTASLPGNVSVTANNCVTLATTSDNSIRQTDVVNFSLQP